MGKSKSLHAEPPPPLEAAADPSNLLTVPEVAKLLRLTPKGVYALVAGRRIPHIKVSNRVRFSYADVVEWLRKNRVPALESI